MHYDYDAAGNHEHSHDADDRHQQNLGRVYEQFQVPGLLVLVRIGKDAQLTVRNDWRKHFNLVQPVVDAVGRVELLQVVVATTDALVNVRQLQAVEALLGDLGGYAHVLVVVIQRGHHVSEGGSWHNDAELRVLVRVGRHHLRLDEKAVVVHVVVNEIQAEVSVAGLNKEVHLAVLIEINRHYHGGISRQRGDKVEA